MDSLAAVTDGVSRLSLVSIVAFAFDDRPTTTVSVVSPTHMPPVTIATEAASTEEEEASNKNGNGIDIGFGFGGLLSDQLETIKAQILHEYQAIVSARQEGREVSSDRERRLEVKLRLYRSLISARMIARLHNARASSSSSIQPQPPQQQLQPLQQPQQPRPQQPQQPQQPSALDRRIVAMQRIASNLSRARGQMLMLKSHQRTSRTVYRSNTNKAVHHHTRLRPRSQPTTSTTPTTTTTTLSAATTRHNRLKANTLLLNRR